MGSWIPRVPNSYNLWVVIYAGIGQLAAAYSLAVLGSTIGQATFYTSLGLAFPSEPGYDRTTNILAALNGSSSAGAAFGALFNSWSADRLSRKYTIMLGNFILVVGAGLSAGSVDVGMFIAARFISGLGIGVLFSVIPMYLGEVSTPETRGFCGCIQGVYGATGYTLSSWLGFGLSFITSSGSSSEFPWRFPLAFGALPALVILVGTPWLPFSPRWLMQQGRFDEAEAVLKRLHAKKGESDHELAKKEFIQIRRQFELDMESRKEVRWYEIFRTAPNRRRSLIAWIATWGTVFTGPIVVASYAVILFTELGLTGYMPLLLLGIWSTIAMPGNFMSVLFLDHFGRRKFLLIGAIGLLLTLVIECALQAQYAGTTNVAGQRAAIFFFYIFIVIFTVFIDATLWVYLNEIYPTHIRSQGMGWGMFNYFCATIVVLVAGPIALNNIGWKFFFVLIVPTACFAVAIFFLFPETCLRSLEDINAQFGEKVAVRYFNATAEDEKEYQHAMEVEDIVGETKMA